MGPELIDRLIIKNESKIVYLIMDGLGGLPLEDGGRTELETARTPNLDALARQSVCGLLDPIGYGITPGSGPAHFSLFGYDPVKTNVGRGLLSAAGVDFPITDRDLFMRVNFATIDGEGRVIDRRAGRIDTEENRRICAKLKSRVQLPDGIEAFFETEKEHRGLFVLRGDDLREEIGETDPQKTREFPHQPTPLIPEAEKTAGLIRSLMEQCKTILGDEKKANMVLFRGYSRFHRFPSMGERFGLKPLAIASYPMYRGIARLLGMTVAPLTTTIDDEIQTLEQYYREYDFFFIHVKPTDSRGEDGDFEAKVKVIEEVDTFIPRITALNPDVLVVTGDHSTPAALAGHSWHPVPAILYAKTCRPDGVCRFGERDCTGGGLGRIPMVYLMGLALAHARRLEKFGA
ncbi:MAG: 2,3-bisphosphoglycerate-independent phosphoglycerate mutase [Syntrophales bacterium]|jgi:2,3-bisphosphoglycerate-independent phosphoglycerate mutase|nr:2,3-bisphosphoglycerate-independent phosphoglycerate mutase [Syntrophales bacterium]